jgi:DnaK suppressor protein
MKARKALDRETTEVMRRRLDETRSGLVEAIRNVSLSQAVCGPAAGRIDGGPGTWVADLQAALISRHTRKLAEVESALARLDRGEYGLCDDCGGAIGLGRLRVLPFAARCGRCQAQADVRLRGATRTVVGRVGARRPVPVVVLGGQPTRPTGARTAYGVRKRMGPIRDSATPPTSLESTPTEMMLGGSSGTSP